MASYQIPLKDSPEFIPQYWSYPKETVVRPSGVDSTVQFNKNNRFGSDINKFFYVDSTDTLNVPNMDISTSLVVRNAVFFNNLLNASKQNVVYFDTSTKQLSYGIVDALPSQAGNSNRFLTTNGTNPSWAVISFSPAGSSSQIQYNRNGAFAGDADFYYNESENRLYVPYVQVGEDITVGTNLINTSRDFARVGINTANPAYTLDITGDLNYTGSLRRNGTIQPVLTIGGSNTHVQFNSSGSLAGASSLTWNNITSTLTTHNLTVSNYLTLSTIALETKPNILFYDTSNKQVSYGALSIGGGGNNTIQYKTSTGITGSATFSYDPSLGFLSIETNTGAPFMRIRELTYNTSKVDVSPDGLTMRDPNSDDTLSEFLHNQSKTPKQYLTGTQSNSRTGQVLVRADDDGEVCGDSNITYNESTNTLLCNKLTVSSDLTVNGQFNTSSIVISGVSQPSTTGVSNGFPAGGMVNQIISKNSSTNYDYSWANISNVILNSISGSTNQILARTVSSLSFQSIASLLINSLSGGSVGQYLQLQASNTLGWASVSSGGGGGSATIQFGEWFLGTEFTASGSGAETAIRWDGTSSSNITGLSINTSTGAITIPSAGLYTFCWSLGMNGSTSTGSRQTWLRIGSDTQRRGAMSSTSGGSTIFFIGSSLTYYFSANSTVTIFIAHNSSNVAVHAQNSSSPTNQTSVSKLQITRIA
jgi:hypothetical protein